MNEPAPMATTPALSTMIRCPECGHNVSQTAAFCPTCGALFRLGAMNVIVRDVDVSFGNLVWLTVKVALAAIPATILLAVIAGGVFALLSGVFAALFHLGR